MDKNCLSTISLIIMMSSKINTGKLELLCSSLQCGIIMSIMESFFSIIGINFSKYVFEGQIHIWTIVLSRNTTMYNIQETFIYELNENDNFLCNIHKYI